MYVYTIQAMPGCKAKFDGDTSVKYQVRRKQTTTALAKAKNGAAVIRTDMDYTAATALVLRFNDKERESLAIRKADLRLTQNV